MPYEFKPSPYSSHSLLVGALPVDGRGQRVLDLGCGNGYLSEILARRGYRVTGVERPGGYDSPFPAAVELVESDLDAGLPDVGGGFSFILCADILEHLKNPRAMLLRLGPLLAPDGRLIASLPNSGHLYFRLNVLAGRFPQHDRGLFDRTHRHFLTWHGWQELLGGANFAIERVRVSGVPVGLALPRWNGTLAVRALERLCYDSARVWKGLFAYQFVVTARPSPRI